MNKTTLCAIGAMTIVLSAGCIDLSSQSRTGNQNFDTQGQMNIVGGGVGQDTPARVYQEYGQDTSCYYRDGHGIGSGGYAALSPCPDVNGYPHDGKICSTFKWSVQFRNDHPTDVSEEKYGLPYDPLLINSLQEWRASHQELRFYFVRYSDTSCKFTDNEVIYCAELTSLSLENSKMYGCINAMHRTFPGLDPSWTQSLGFSDPQTGVADGTSGAPGS